MSEQITRTDIQLNVIAIVESCYKQKFAIPRQPGLVPSSKAFIRFLPPYNDPRAFVGLEQSSHVWVQFVFHEAITKRWQPSVRPPRLGGNKKLGVFATRSSHRPNPLGLSVVKLESIDSSDGVVLCVSGIDLLDQTPVLDVKPYIPYVDRVDSAENGFAEKAPSHCPVSFSIQAKEDLAFHSGARNMGLNEDENPEQLIVEVLRQDPRPAYQAIDTNRVYGVALNNVNVRWRYLLSDKEISIEVLDLKPLDD